MTCLFDNDRDFVLGKIIETSIDILPSYNLTLLYHMATRKHALPPAEWISSIDYLALLENNAHFNCSGVYTGYNGNVFVEEPLVFLAYLRHVIGDDINNAIDEHTIFYKVYNKADDIENERFILPEYNLRPVYTAISCVNELIEPLYWTESDPVFHELLPVIESYGVGYNLGLVYTNDNYHVMSTKSTLVYLTYIKYCLDGNTITQIIDKIIAYYDNLHDEDEGVTA